MARLLLGLVVVVVVATIYAVIDCAMIAHDRVRGLPKPVWLVIILVLPVVGVVLWFIIGRGRSAQPRARQLPPDDNPAFFGQTSGVDRDQDERIRRLEEELAALDSEDTSTPQPGATGRTGTGTGLNSNSNPGATSGPTSTPGASRGGAKDDTNNTDESGTDAETDSDADDNGAPTNGRPTNGGPDESSGTGRSDV